MTDKEFEKLPQEVKNILNSYDDNNGMYEDSMRIGKELEQIGWSSDFGLDGEIHTVTKKDISKKVDQESTDIDMDAFNIENTMLDDLADAYNEDINPGETLDTEIKNDIDINNVEVNDVEIVSANEKDLDNKVDLNQESNINLATQIAVSHLVIQTQDSLEFKDYKSENLDANVIDYLKDLKNDYKSENNDLYAKRLDETIEQVDVFYGASKDIGLDADKFLVDRLKSDIENSDSYKSFIQEFQIEDKEQLNVIDYLNKEASKPNIDKETFDSLNQKAERILKHYPELNNSVISEKKGNTLQNRDSVIRASFIKELEKQQNFNTNPDKMAQEILEGLIFPIKVAQRAMLEKKNLKNKPEEQLSVLMNNEVYNVVSYSKDMTKIHLRKQGEPKSELIALDNDGKLKIIPSKNIQINDIQKDLLQKGKRLLITKGVNVPVIAKVEQGKLVFKPKTKKDLTLKEEQKLKNSNSLKEKIKSKLKLG